MKTKCDRVGCTSQAEYKGFCTDHMIDQRDEYRTHYRRPGPEWYKLYRSKAWKRLRAIALAHQPLCVRCMMYGRTTVGEEVDHVIPHKGDERLFNDLANLQVLCGSCHSVKTSYEKQGYAQDYRGSVIIESNLNK